MCPCVSVLTKFCPSPEHRLRVEKPALRLFYEIFVVVKSPQKEKVEMPVYKSEIARLYVGITSNLVY